MPAFLCGWFGKGFLRDVRGASGRRSRSAYRGHEQPPPGPPQPSQGPASSRSRVPGSWPAVPVSLRPRPPLRGRHRLRGPGRGGGAPPFPLPQPPNCSGHVPAPAVLPRWPPRTEPIPSALSSLLSWGDTPARSGAAACGKVVCSAGGRRGVGARRRGRRGRGEEPPPKTACMNLRALDLPPRSAQ